MIKNKLTFILFINLIILTFTPETRAEILNQGNNMASKIIGIMGISGAGKTTVTKKLAESLHSTVVFWDEFDDISTSPEDLIEWYKNSKDYTAWNYQGLADTLNTLKQGNRAIHPVNHEELIPTEVILFDAPLGFKHQQTGKYIDYLVCIDTPLDIALARRLLRDFQNKKDELVNEIIEE
ncbi:MAG: AAA family ATPase, partial [Silvanigrellaceae bacterium]|nr:AAA family ATPase [Silvanigrellaceae bacterium]